MARAIQGEEFIVTIETVETNRIVAELVREKLPAAELADVMESSSYEKMSTKRLDSSKKSKFEMPNLGNATPEGLADMLGELREKMSNDKKLEELYKEKLKVAFRKQDQEDKKDD